mmetsp:Transcript_134391/g.318583  ORF Transcript_134391/g.318583 Transcript_134391/m.318583 type:complete len:202 (-) Transcript_134391:715-1320(-)
MASALIALAIWSAKPGQTTTGTPAINDSMKLFCPPCVKKRSTPARRSSTWGKWGRHRALLGTVRFSKASGWDPMATTSSGAWSTAPCTPKASKAADQAAWQSCLPVTPFGFSVPSLGTSCQPTVLVSETRMVPMLTRITWRPALRASLTACTGSTGPSTRCGGVSSSKGPTGTNVAPASSYAAVSSGVTGSWKSAPVVTKL